MNWQSQDSSGVQQVVDSKKAEEYEQAKAAGLPVVTKEADAGVKPFDPLKFQPVRSPGIYESEFAVKDKDIIFHFWPDGYHKAERNGLAAPTFLPDFKTHLMATMYSIFGSNRITLEEDKDIGAFYVKAHGWGEHDSHRQISINACELFHKAMGGSEG